MSPPLRASNEGLLRPRVARAQGTHRAITPLLVDFFSILPDRLREDEYAGSRIASGFQLLQSAIGIGEGERQGVGFDGNRSRLAQEIEAVLLRIGRDASNDPLSKDFSIVVERGNRRHVNTGEGKRAAAFQ